MVLKKVIEVFVIVIVSFLILILFFFLVLGTINQFSLGRGDSMKPTFEGCIFFLIDDDVNPELLQTGDIAVFDVSDVEGMNTSIITHRVVRNYIETQEITMRGDNDELYYYDAQVDAKLEYEKVLGKVKRYFNIPEIVCDIMLK